jgi:CheY-like chemotaxis protein
MAQTAETSPSPPESKAAVEAPPLAPGAVPLCYVVDDEPSLRHFVSLVMHGVGVDTVECADGAAFRNALDGRLPDLIFHDVALESADGSNR